MFKKILSVVLISLLVLAGCTGKPKEEPVEDTAAQTQLAIPDISKIVNDTFILDSPEGFDYSEKIIVDGQVAESYRYIQDVEKNIVFENTVNKPSEDKKVTHVVLSKINDKITSHASKIAEDEKTFGTMMEIFKSDLLNYFETNEISNVSVDLPQYTYQLTSNVSITKSGKTYDQLVWGVDEKEKKITYSLTSSKNDAIKVKVEYKYGGKLPLVVTEVEAMLKPEKEETTKNNG